MSALIRFAFGNRWSTSGFAEDRVEVRRARGEVGADGAEFGAVDDELGTEVDECLRIAAT